jgi:Flp pilus assembly protein CpaB
VVDIAQNLFSTRRGSILVGVGAAVIAGIVLFAYLHAYRNSVKSSAVPASVLVAKNLIKKGTPGDIIGSGGQYQVASVPKSQLQLGALTDPATLTGRVAATDIYPGQQLTAASFVFATPGTLSTKLSGTDRAITINMDAQRGMIGLIGGGDRVDIFVGLNVDSGGPVIKLLLSNVLVLRAPYAGGNGAYTLRVPEAQAAQLAYASDNGHLWFVARPASGARVQLPGIVTARTLLLGYKAVK